MAHRIDYGRMALMPVFAFMLLVNGMRLAVQWDEVSVLASLSTLAALTFYAVLAVQYLRRGPARSTDRRPVVWAVAAAGTFAPFAVPLVAGDPPSGGVVVVGLTLVAAGLAGAVWSLLALGRNVSVVPQAREVATDGPYRWFRHPLYAFELVALLGLCLVSGGVGPYLVLLACAALLVARATWEEDLLHAELSGYAEYAARVPGLSWPSRRTLDSA